MRNIFLFNTSRLAGLDLWILIIRVIVGSAMLTHGFPKMEKLLSGNMEFADPIGIGEGISLVLTVFSEAICSLFIIAGLFTRLAIIAPAFTMCVAFFIVHGGDPFGKKELALLYLLIYVTLFFTGSGNYSMDRLIAGKRNN